MLSVLAKRFLVYGMQRLLLDMERVMKRVTMTTRMQRFKVSIECLPVSMESYKLEVNKVKKRHGKEGLKEMGRVGGGDVRENR